MVLVSTFRIKIRETTSYYNVRNKMIEKPEQRLGAQPGGKAGEKGSLSERKDLVEVRGGGTLSAKKY